MPLADSETPTLQSEIRNLESLLVRPDDQRLREYKYRFAQTAVFGLPVIFLQYVGPSLGGPESDRWIALLQAILTGWITYVGAAGMLFEGLILFARRRPTLELLIAIAAMGLYLFSAISVTGVLLRGALFYRPLRFHLVVYLLAIWSSWRWWRMNRRLKPTG